MENAPPLYQAFFSPRQFCARELLHIPVQECDEECVALAEWAPLCDYQPINADMRNAPHGGMVARKTLAQKLHEASHLLLTYDSTLQLRVVYALRDKEIQQRYFDTIYVQLQGKFPKLSQEELREKTHLTIAIPEVAGHPCGAAIDVTLLTQGSDELDMGTRIWDLSSERVQFFHPDQTLEVKRNRSLLRRVLMETGFCPFDGEWWHFSYGDREWAAYYGMKCAIYGLFG